MRVVTTNLGAVFLGHAAVVLSVAIVVVAFGYFLFASEFSHHVAHHVHGDFLDGQNGIGVGKHAPKGFLRHERLHPVGRFGQHEEFGQHVRHVDAGNAKGQDTGVAILGHKAADRGHARFHHVHHHGQGQDPTRAEIRHRIRLLKA